MANELYRDGVLRKIEYAVRQYKHAALIDHYGIVGRVRELAINQLLEPLLPPDIRVGTGKIVDADNVASNEMDLVIYNPGILPPALYDEHLGVFPAESCAYAVQVKSTLNADQLRSSIENLRSIDSLKMTPGHFTPEGKPALVATFPIRRALFSFSSDLTGSGKSELDRYMENDAYEAEKRCPHIHEICVVGKGFWYYKRDDDGKIYWETVGASPEHEEVLHFLKRVHNMLPDNFLSRGNPDIGRYF